MTVKIGTGKIILPPNSKATVQFLWYIQNLGPGLADCLAVYRHDLEGVTLLPGHRTPMRVKGPIHFGSDEKGATLLATLDKIVIPGPANPDEWELAD